MSRRIHLVTGWNSELHVWRSACGLGLSVRGTLRRYQVDCPACLAAPEQLELVGIPVNALQAVAALVVGLLSEPELDCAKAEHASARRFALESADQQRGIRQGRQLRALKLAVQLAQEQGVVTRHRLVCEGGIWRTACGADGECVRSAADVTCVACLLELEPEPEPEVEPEVALWVA